MTDEVILNKEQKTAIEYGEGPLLIIAGAGTGKTTVITERINKLITNRGVKPHEILALTFTEKAAREMEERVDRIMPYGYTQMWIETFHSFCDLILKEEAINIGLSPNYRLMSEADSVLLLRKNIFNLGLSYYKTVSNPTKFLEALLEHFSKLQDEDITPSQYLKFSKEISNDKFQISNNKNVEEEEINKTVELANAYQTYTGLKAREGLMDFSDLIANTLLLFRTRKNILRKYQEQFKYILVDEFQDTNYAQNELAILLAGDKKNITVVADDDQAIYRWRGAAISNVLQFKENFKGAKIVTLTRNYRSTQEILDKSYTLIKHNDPHRLEVMENINKKLTSERKIKGKAIEFIYSERIEEEAENIAQKIMKLVKEEGRYDYRDFAILVRANSQAQPISRALQRFKIPYQFLGPGQLFHQEEIKDLIAYLKVLYNLEDAVSLFRVLNMDIFEIDAKDINYLLNLSRKRHSNLFEILGKTDETFLSNDAKEKLKKIQEMILRHLDRVKRDSAGQILYYFLIDTEIFKKLIEYKTEAEEKRAQNIAKFFDRIKNFEFENQDTSIYAVVDWIDLMMQIGDSPAAASVDWRDINAVNILTVHSSKGLEFPVVFLINLVTNRFPCTERKEKIPLPPQIIKEVIPEGDYHIQEERRLFYVGMTRARDLLFFTASAFYGEGKRERKISNFIFETLGNISINKKGELKEVKQLSLIELGKYYEEKEERTIKKPPLKINYVSYSHIQAFSICPLHYKARYIDFVPTPMSSALAFGITIHSALNNFYKQVREGRRFSENDLIEIIDKSWVGEGYDSKLHEKEARIKAENLMKKYLNNYFDQNQIPQALELPFSFHLSRDEIQKELSVSNTRNAQGDLLKVTGKIDRIDVLPSGAIEIIDYKTGSGDSNFKAAYDLQLGIYALAATKVEHPLLRKKPEEIKLTLFYLETGEKITHSFKGDDLLNIEQKVIDKVREIEKSDFKCSANLLCAKCEYKMLCNTHSV
ncbi:ATP-dependent helicase [Candidatus Parcubacteria bacterium]|nr:MAG: ATP-dependent helicase [Candidatus Parcubacteria bacterium]